MGIYLNTCLLDFIHVLGAFSVAAHLCLKPAVVLPLPRAMQGARGSDKGAEWFIENVFEELDGPNEYFYNATSGKVPSPRQRKGGGSKMRPAFGRGSLLAAGCTRKSRIFL